jgi:hypothetical protein
MPTIEADTSTVKSGLCTPAKRLIREGLFLDDHAVPT